MRKGTGEAASQMDGHFATLAAVAVRNDFVSGDGASDGEIGAVEAELGVPLPSSYRQFLRLVGYAHWPEYIWGAGRRGVGPNGVAGSAEREREQAYPPMQHALVPFSPDGWGNHYCLDTAKMENGECPVVFWDHDQEPDQIPEFIAPTFADWLQDLLREQLEYEAEEAREANKTAEDGTAQE